MVDGRYHPPGTNLGGASGDALAGRIALWTRRKALARVDFYRVMRGVEHLDDFDAGPESPDEIGAFALMVILMATSLTNSCENFSVLSG